MKNDYLWDKTGEDAEIEKLENALKAFRYVETAPPVLPAKVLQVEKEKPRKFFQFGFAFAAFVVILFAVWFQISGNKIKVINDVAETNATQSDDKVADKTFITKPEAPPVKKVEAPAHFNKQNIVKVSKFAVISRHNKTVAKTKKPTETLTAEEKYAYNQLMLALSITSSSLKIVKDKIQGIEEQNAVLDTAR